MDANYVYMIAAREGEEFHNAGGDFWKGLFNKGGGGTGAKGGDGEGIDPKAATETGLAILGLVGGWLAQRKARKAEEERAGIYVPPYTPPPKNNTALYVVGGLAVVGIGVAIYLATKKK